MLRRAKSQHSYTVADARVWSKRQRWERRKRPPMSRRVGDVIVAYVVEREIRRDQPDLRHIPGKRYRGVPAHWIVGQLTGTDERGTIEFPSHNREKSIPSVGACPIHYMAGGQRSALFGDEKGGAAVDPPPDFSLASLNKLPDADNEDATLWGFLRSQWALCDNGRAEERDSTENRCR